MNWRYYIHSDPEILVGKPVVKGTRLSVDFLLNLFANGWTQEQILENYPTLTPEALQAVFAKQKSKKFIDNYLGGCFLRGIRGNIYLARVGLDLPVQTELNERPILR